MKSEYLKKITQLEQDKKKLSETLDSKANEIERLRSEIEDKNVNANTKAS